MDDGVLVSQEKYPSGQRRHPPPLLKERGLFARVVIGSMENAALVVAVQRSKVLA